MVLFIITGVITLVIMLFGYFKEALTFGIGFSMVILFAMFMADTFGSSGGSGYRSTDPADYYRARGARG